MRFLDSIQRVFKWLMKSRTTPDPADAAEEDYTRLLGEETLLDILQLLPPESLFLAGQVCRLWRRLSRDRRLSQHLQLQLLAEASDSGSSLRRVARALLVAPTIKSLAVRLETSPSAADRRLRIVKKCTCTIHELDLSGTSVWLEPKLYYELLRKHCHSLVSLSIGDLDKVIIPLIESMENLRHLSVKTSSVPQCAPSKASKLKHLSSLRMKLKYDPDSRLLKTLLDDNSDSLEDVSVYVRHNSTLAILLRCRNLRKLEINDVVLGRYRLDKDFLLWLEELPALSELILMLRPEHYHVQSATPYFSLNAYHLEFLPAQIRSLRISGVEMNDHYVQPLLKRLHDMSNLQCVELTEFVSESVKEAFGRCGPPAVKYVFSYNETKQS